jgi:hypothetical protein
LVLRCAGVAIEERDVICIDKEGKSTSRVSP